MNDSASILPETSSRRFKCGTVASLAAAALLFSPGAARADELKTVGGERLVGKTVSINEHTIVFASTALGKITIARSNVLALNLGSSAMASAPVATNLSAGVSGTSTNQNSELEAVLRSLPAQPQLAENASKDLLANAGPEATEKFNQLLRGLLTGKMSMGDLRAEAQSVRDQAKAIRADLGDEAGGVLDGYLAILDKFLAQTPAPQPPAKSAGAPSGK